MLELKKLKQLIVFVLPVLCIASCTKNVPEQAKESVTRPASSDIIKLTPEAFSKIGIKTTGVERRVIYDDIVTTGQIQSDENRVFHINSLAPGRVIEDKVILGDLIKPGQTLAIIENLEVARIYADFIRRYHENDVEIKDADTKLALAKNSLNRTQQLYDENIAPQKALIQAQADHTLAARAVEALKEKSTHIEEEARSLLSAYGVTLHNIQSEKLQTTSPIVAPRGGVITKKNVTVGDVVAVQQTLYEVADLSQVWLDITIYDKDLGRVKEGQVTEFVSDSLPKKTFTGAINYMRPSTGDNTRTFLARVVLKNPGFLLKPGMFGQVTIQEPASQSQVFVPSDAVQSYGKEDFVFVDLGEARYRKQPVKLGKKVVGGFLLESGVGAGEPIVTKGSFNLKAAVLKGEFAEED
ncbi:MAG TPA: efflux RND transporter periplasmic adaptor subunit [Candidatus Melainabacteria bacterium]|jgi:cobalt-zinc-cadmium efflux system membrane fusion protein|nr:efflux RND transporter periplasmic adaptor subunit [Candidatus Melainabacteria bacterium]HIN63042.1 efflux RND transporter periplasmic adaptor subunit [Candidatus Obscuribacterales bacterium]